MTTPIDLEFYAYLVEKAIDEHRISANHREKYIADFQADPEGTRAFLAAIPPFLPLPVSADVPAPVLARSDRWGQPPSDANVVYSAMYPDCG